MLRIVVIFTEHEGMKPVFRVLFKLLSEHADKAPLQPRHVTVHV